MYLKFLEITNFRSIAKAKCIFNPGLNLVIGPNDSGKTALVDAIRYALKQVVDDYSRVNYSDFNEPSREISIDFTFSFDEDADEDRITRQTSRFAEYLSFNDVGQPELKVWYSVKSGDSDIRHPSFRVGPFKDVAVEMNARCKENLWVVYLRPLRDAEFELRARQGSRISKILRELKEIKSSKGILEDFLRKFDEASTNFFGVDSHGRHGAGKPISDRIKTLLDSFDEQSPIQNKEIKFGPTEKIDYLKTLERIALYYRDLTNPGLGTQNMIFIAAELLHLDTQENPSLILVEEIEAHLHPQRQLKIIKALQEESKRGLQMILTTHSPILASVVDVERIGIFYKGEFFSLAKDQTALSANNYSYLGRFLDATKSNLFFSQGVILVEGATEQLLLPEFSKLLGTPLTDYGISIVSVHGLGFEHFVNIFKRSNEPYNKVPVAVVTDADKRSQARIDLYKQYISSIDNRIKCFVGDQISSKKDISKDRGTTLEKIVLEKTIELRKLYIEAYNSLQKTKRSHLKDDMANTYLYSKIRRIKAPLAQEIAQRLSNPDATIDTNKIATEIKSHLIYIVDSISFVISPTQVAGEGAV